MGCIGCIGCIGCSWEKKGWPYTDICLYEVKNDMTAMNQFVKELTVNELVKRQRELWYNRKKRLWLEHVLHVGANLLRHLLTAQEAARGKNSGWSYSSVSSTAREWYYIHGDLWLVWWRTWRIISTTVRLVSASGASGFDVKVVPRGIQC